MYGPDTEAAVTSYKTARNILNFAGLIDPIVGKKTIAALDVEIERFDASAGGAGSGTRLRFAGLEEALDTDLGFDEMVELFEAALEGWSAGQAQSAARTRQGAEPAPARLDRTNLARQRFRQRHRRAAGPTDEKAPPKRGLQ